MGDYNSRKQQQQRMHDEAIAQEKIHPHDIESEKALLGSLLIDPDAWNHPEIVALKPDDFYRESHHMIFEAMLVCLHEDGGTDFVVVTEKIETAGKLQDVGGEDYIISLAGIVPTSANAPYYASIVAKHSAARKIINACMQAMAQAYQGEVEAAVTTMLEGATSLTSHKAQDLIPVREGIPDLVEEIERRQESKTLISGVPTGLTDLDRLLQGLQPETLNILAARPAVGKSAAAQGFAWHSTIKGGKRVAIFSLEMSRLEINFRLLSMQTGIDSRRLRQGDLEDRDWETIVKHLPVLDNAEIYVDDSSGISPLQVEHKLRQLIAKVGVVDLVIIDYLQLMQPSSGKRTDNRVLDVSSISRELKILARKLGVAILALSQLSRAVESRQSKVPQLSDLRESGSIEQDADVVMFIYRDDVYNPETERVNQADFIVAKHRNGPIGEVAAFLHKPTTRFHDLDERTPPPTDEGDEGSSYYDINNYDNDPNFVESEVE